MGSAKPAFLYVIGSQQGPHKIGVSVSPDKRLVTLQTGNPEKLLLKRTTPSPVGDAVAVEAYAHWLLRESAILNEWFKVTEEAAWVALTAASEAVAQGLSVPTQERFAGPGRPRVNEPGQEMTARFAPGTRERIFAVLQPKESLAAFLRSAIEAELKRRERTRLPSKTS